MFLAIQSTIQLRKEVMKVSNQGHLYKIIAVTSTNGSLAKTCEIIRGLSTSDITQMKRVGTNAYLVSFYSVQEVDDLLWHLKENGVHFILLLAEGGSVEFQSNIHNEFVYPKYHRKQAR